MRIRHLVLGALLAGLLALVVRKVRVDRDVAQAWAALTESPPDGRRFSAGMVDGLPEPARRYFLRAIDEGTPIATQLHWTYGGTIRPSKDLPWMELEAEQILVKERGFVWKALTRQGPVVVTAADQYFGGEGKMRINLFGLIPIVDAAGPDISRSARGPLLLEGVALPSMFLPGPNTRIESVDDSRFTVTITLDGEETPITLTVDEDGRLQSMEMQRWGNVTADGSFRYIPYGGTVADEWLVDGYTIPSTLSAGWWYGTDDYLEVVRIKVDSVRYV